VWPAPFFAATFFAATFNWLPQPPTTIAAASSIATMLTGAGFIFAMRQISLVRVSII